MTGVQTCALPISPVTTPPATLTRVRVVFRAVRGAAARGSYIVSGEVSHAGTIDVTLTIPPARTGGRATTIVRSYTVDAGPFAVSTQVTRRGATVQLVYTPDNPALDPVITNPGVERVVQGTQTHLPGKARRTR